MCKLDKEHCICYLVAWTSQVQKHKTHTACYTHLLKISTKYVSKEKKKKPTIPKICSEIMIKLYTVLLFTTVYKCAPTFIYDCK